ncbi:MAG: DUF2934 domain-containing protein [Thermodesulfobacteriota bacterium]
MAKVKGIHPKRRTENPKFDEETHNDLIRKKAYEIYEKRGRSHGKDLDDWIEAENIVKGKRKRRLVRKGSK